MKKQLHKINAIAALIILGSYRLAFSQVNPTVKTLPFYEDFGITTFTALPTGFASGMVSSAPLATQTAAQSSAATAAASLATATTPQTNGGSYGYAHVGDAKFYVQHSASTSTGTNQLIMAINTVNWHSILISYGVEMINANPRTAGLILQYRVGTTGTWTNISNSIYSHNSTDRTNGTIDNYTNLTLPTAADNQPIVQLRWASWRGTQTGNSSGVAVDNVSVSASPQGLSTNVSVSSTPNCGELFISEYVHQTDLNRAIEIYNPTAASKNLSGYYLTITTGTNTATYIPLSGTIQSGKTWVVANQKAASAITSLANQLVPNFNYSGNDVIGLVYSTNPMVSDVMIDAIGDPTFTPTNGYTVTALGDTGTTQNHTLTRLMTIPRGNTEWGKAKFEWYSHPMNTFTFLGWHNSVCVTASLPVADFVLAPPLQKSLYSDIQNSVSTDNFNFNISLVGTWSNPVLVYYNDTYNYTNYFTNVLNCNTPTAAQTSDYSYNPLGQNLVVFTTAQSNTQAVQSFPIQIDVTSTQSDIISNGTTYVWACFGIDVDPNGTQGFYSYSIGNSYTANLYITTDDLSGIQTLFNNKQIKIYPNPFSNQVTIENKSQTPITKISVSDVLGREVITSTPNQLGTINIDTHTFDNGVYFIKVYNNSDSYSVKLIKE